MYWYEGWFVDECTNDSKWMHLYSETGSSLGVAEVVYSCGLCSLHCTFPSHILSCQLQIHSSVQASVPAVQQHSAAAQPPGLGSLAAIQQTFRVPHPLEAHLCSCPPMGGSLVIAALRRVIWTQELQASNLLAESSHPQGSRWTSSHLVHHLDVWQQRHHLAHRLHKAQRLPQVTHRRAHRPSTRPHLLQLMLRPLPPRTPRATACS
jgi:hypothetical protein